MHKLFLPGLHLCPHHPVRIPGAASSLCSSQTLTLPLSQEAWIQTLATGKGWCPHIAEPRVTPQVRAA